MDVNFNLDLDYARFVKDFKQLTGIDLALYKEAQMKRRLTTLCQRRGFHTFEDYFQAVKMNKALLDELMDRMTINVSEFWRNPNRWEILDNQYITKLAAESGRLKCWSAACSTGEEPYTLAMILARRGMLQRADILATDIDPNALAAAKQGVYHERSLKDVPPDYIQEFFTKNGELYAVSESLKRSVTFAKGDLLKDPFGANFDLIICRNVMIYFTEEAKELLYRKFADALRPGGILFVGATEQILYSSQYGLKPASSFFYQKSETPDHV